MGPLRRPLGLALAVLVLALTAPPAAAQQPVCGQVVTGNVRLEQNLRCPESDGLVVGADGITIDLNGHTIDAGVGTHGGPSAIDNGRGHDGVTVRNGSVTSDGASIRLVGASGNRVVDISAAADSCCAGLSVEGGGGNRVVRGRFAGGRGIFANGSDFLRITGADVTGYHSVALEFAGSWAVIAHNTVRDYPMYVAGNGNRVSANVVVGGLVVGIGLVSGADNVIARNWVVDSRQALTNDGTGDGIQVGAFTAGTVIRENIAVRNADDGIALESSHARLVRNLANDNADLGIDALPGTFAIGNLASGNGNPAQCTGVPCG